VHYTVLFKFKHTWTATNRQTVTILTATSTAPPAVFTNYSF